jgi:hypothetical protein
MDEAGSPDMSSQPAVPRARHHALNTLFSRLGTKVSPNSCDLVVLDGHLDLPRLRAAARATLARHPILCRPLALKGAPPPSLPVDLRVHRIDHDRAAAVDAHLERQIWDEPFAPDARPVRFCVTETPRRTYLQTIHTHVYADATACYAITEELAQRYASPHADGFHADGFHADGFDAGEPTSGARVDLLPPGGKRLLHHARGLARTARDLTAHDGTLALARHRRPGPRRLTRLCLSAGETTQLLGAARARGHSLHAFFQVAFTRAAAALHRRRGVERARLRAWDFFSMRPLIERDRPRYDCLALIYPIDLDTRWSDEEILARATQRVQRMRGGELADHAARFESLRGLPEGPFLRLWPRLFKSNVFLTNPGVCPSPLPRFGEVPVRDYVTFPQLFWPADLLFVFSTFRGRLRVLTIRDEAAFGDRFHDELLAPFIETLGALGGLRLSPAAALDGFAARWADAEDAPHAAAIKRSA